MAPKSPTTDVTTTVKPPSKAAPVATEAELAALAAAAPKDERLKPTEGVVARGHTVVTGPGPENEFGPGKTITASKQEIEKLRGRGVLVDPSRIIAPLGTGPRFFKEDEASKGDKVGVAEEGS